MKKIPIYHTKYNAEMEKAVVMSLSALKRYDKKHKLRVEITEKIKEELRENGASEEEIKKVPLANSPYIHSISTLQTYVREGIHYVHWLQWKHPETHKLKYALRKGYAREYIDWLIANGYSPSSIATKASALAKLYRTTIPELYGKLPKREYKDFTRSRAYTLEKFDHDIKKYGVIAEICYDTGTREHELEHIAPKDFSYDVNGTISLHLDGKILPTKGGRPRTIIVQQENQARLKAILSTLPENELICPAAPSGLDVQAIRRLYAQALYKTVARDVKTIKKTERVLLKHPKIDNRRPGKIRTTAPAIYHSYINNADYDRVALLIVSEALGHGREDVVVHDYLDRALIA